MNKELIIDLVITLLYIIWILGLIIIGIKYRRK